MADVNPRFSCREVFGRYHLERETDLAEGVEFPDPRFRLAGLKHQCVRIGVNPVRYFFHHCGMRSLVRCVADRELVTCLAGILDNELHNVALLDVGAVKHEMHLIVRLDVDDLGNLGFRAPNCSKRELSSRKSD